MAAENTEHVAPPETAPAAGDRYGVYLDSFGASGNGHWYGVGWRVTPNGDEEQHRLQYHMTAEQAAGFNSLDPTTPDAARYHEGDTSERFETHAAGLQAGLALLRELYGYESDVEIGRPAYVDSRTVRITPPLSERRIDAACPACERVEVLVIHEWDDSRTTIGCTWCMWGDTGTTDDELLRQVRDGLD